MLDSFDASGARLLIEVIEEHARRLAPIRQPEIYQQDQEIARYFVEMNLLRQVMDGELPDEKVALDAVLSSWV